MAGCVWDKEVFKHTVGESNLKRETPFVTVFENKKKKNWNIIKF